MNFLYPLFLAGIAAVGLPIVLHMIRRHTRKRVSFSSLMFLRTTAPRFKNRSRLENLPLLILRCTVLCLLAFGFSRPFFPRSVAENQVRLGRRTVLLIDTSASMRRAGMWREAVNKAQSVLESVNHTDRVCVMSFDQSTQTLIGFEQWGTLDPVRRVSTVTEHISRLSPSWGLTNLGRAVVAAAEAIEDDEVNDEQQAIAVRQVVLISDLQRGSSLEELRGYEWPEGVQLVIKLIKCKATTNAAVQLVVNRDHMAQPDGAELPNIRITNSADAARERFDLRWAEDALAEERGSTAGLYVPAGNSIVVNAPSRADGSAAGKLVLTGDDHDFDNALYLAPHLTQQANILYIGSDDANDSRDMFYYVQRAFGATSSLNPRIVCRPADSLANDDIESANLIIAADTMAHEYLVALRRYLESGGTVLLVMKSPDAATTLAGLAGLEAIEAEEAEVDKYSMLSQIEFEHPLLAPFGEPRFGDFTKIHFWRHRRIDITDLPGADVLAWFDSSDASRGSGEDPAWFELQVGEGSLLVLTSGWHPSDSQLALSSKFVPLLYSMLEYAGVSAREQLQYFIGDTVPILHSIKSALAKNLRVRRPDDSAISLDAGQQTFSQTDLPGIYVIESPIGNQLFAVNVPVKECQTAVMPIEDLESLGVSLEQSLSIVAGRTVQASRHSSFAELEYGQKIWRRVFAALLAVLLIEIWLAGWLTRPPLESEGERK